MNKSFNPLLGIKRYYAIQALKVQAECNGNWKMYNLLIDEEKLLVKKLNIVSPGWRNFKE